MCQKYICNMILIKRRILDSYNVHLFSIEIEAWDFFNSMQSSMRMVSCRTVALWFYILVSDHNATNPVVLKSCNLRRRFFFFGRTLETYFSTFQHCSSKYLLFPKSRHFLLPICMFKQTPNP
jgi:hypothetical protein